MKKNNTQFRKRIEEFLEKNPAAAKEIQHENVQELIENLQVHQIELEMQNEELLRSQLELEAARDKYSDLFDFAPVGYFMFDRQGRIRGVNLTGGRMLGIERSNLIKRPFSRFVTAGDKDRFYRHCQAVYGSKARQTCDLKMVRPDGAQFYARLESEAVTDMTENAVRIRTVVIDITERIRASAALQESEAKFRVLFNEMISGYAVSEILFDASGYPFDVRILDANKAVERITGFKKHQIIGKTIRELFPGLDKSWFDKFSEVATTGNPLQFENYHAELDKHFVVSAFKPGANQFAITFMDITDRKRFEEALQKTHSELEKRVAERTAELAQSNTALKLEIAERERAEQALETARLRLFSVLEELPAYVHLHAPDHSIRFANRYFREHFGPIAGKTCFELLRAQKEPCKVCPTSIVFETGKPQEWESPVLRDGCIYQIYNYPFTDIDGSRLVLELGIDITKRKKTEAELRRISALLLNAQENERRRIAFELHDDLGQDLTVLKLQIGSLKKKIQEDQADLRDMCANILFEMSHTIEKVRRISRDLSPSILADLGLPAALRWLLDNFAKHSQLEISKDMVDIKNLFSDEQQIAIFRIFQEIFTNINKHAKASRVSVAISRHANKVLFTLEDNGKGFNFKAAKARFAPEKGLGLAGMDERVKMIGGQFEISSRKGKGTRVSFEIPIKDAPNDAI